VPVWIQDVWVLNPGASEYSLPNEAAGPDYMLLWSQVLEGEDGLGDFDFAFFAGHARGRLTSQSPRGRWRHYVMLHARIDRILSSRADPTLARLN
jgi:hypothetical protein